MGHRSGALALFFVLAYASLGCCCYYYLEGWDVVTGGFFVTTVITTVGYGNPAPKTTGGRVFTMLYSVIGIVLVGSALGMVAQWFIDQHEARKRRQMEKQMRDTREAAKQLQKRKSAKDITVECREALNMPTGLRSTAVARLGSSRRFAPTRVQASPSGNRVHPAGMAGGGDADAPHGAGVRMGSVPEGSNHEAESATGSGSGAGTGTDMGAGAVAAVSTASIRYMARTSRRRGGCCHSAVRRMKRMCGIYDTFEAGAVFIGSMGRAGLEAQRVRFRAAKAVLVRTWPLLVVLALGAGVGLVEGWGAVDSLYFSVISLTTVGLGDLTPMSTTARALSIVFLPLGVIAATNVVGSLAELKMQEGLAKAKTPEEMLKECIEVIALDNDGTVTREEYMIHMLLKMGKVDDITLELLSQQFDELDADGSGELDDKDIEVLTKRVGLMNADTNTSAVAGASGGGSGAGTGHVGRRSLSSFKIAGLTMKAVGVMTKFARDKRRESSHLANKLREARQRSRQAEADIIAGVPPVDGPPTIPDVIAEEVPTRVDAPSKETDAIEMMIEEIGLDQEQNV